MSAFHPFRPRLRTCRANVTVAEMSVNELIRLLDSTEPPICASLTPFTVEAADLEAGSITVLFAAQPAFSNHFNQVQGGFAAAMLDAVISLAAFAASRRWLPTASLNISYLSPVPLEPCRGRASVLKVGKKLCFVEARLYDGEHVLVTAQATLANSSD